MPRLPRLNPPGIPQHVIQRGNNRQACFAAKEDFVTYAHFLKKSSQQYKVKVHAWVLMTNHVHLLVTSENSNGISKMMQSIGRRYVQYFNYTYKRSGTLWEGRFKSCLIDSEQYLLDCYRYIELNPVRAGMVEGPGEYEWSSYRVNALGVESVLCTPHESYLALGANAVKRQQAYKALFRYHVDNAFIESLRAATKRGLALGSERFKDEVETLCNRSVRANPVGRPKVVKNRC